MARLDARDLLRGDLAKISLAVRTDVERGSPALRFLAAVRRWIDPADEYVVKIPFCPPLPLLWRARASGERSPASVVRQTYYREAWRERSAWSRAKLVAKLLTIWAPINLGVAAWSTTLNGRAAKRRVGKGIARQLLEQAVALCAHDLQAFSYYCFELYDDAHWRRMPEYLQRFETKGGVYLLFKHHLHGASRGELADKVKFDARAREFGLKTIPVLAVGQAGELRHLVGSSLPRTDLFIKRANGRGGEGADWWRHDGVSDTYWNSAGLVLTHGELEAYIARLSLTDRTVVGPRIEGHPDLAEVSNGALSTIRLVTIRNERGGFEATDAVFRMAVGSNTVVDNFHAGGIAANVDLQTGELSAATDLGLRSDRGWCDVHPSGALIAGRKLPFWREAVELVERAHAAFPDRVLIGWDVAITRDGPCIVEGNGGPDLDIHQRCSRKPAGSTRLGELLAYNTRRALAARDAKTAVQP